MQLTSIKTLDRTNFKGRAKSLKLYLMITNLDLTLHENELVVNVDSTFVQRAQYEKWTHSNKVISRRKLLDRI